MPNIIKFGGGAGGSKVKKMAISKLSEGDVVRIKEKGVEQDYYLAQHDYQPSLNGSGRVLFVRKECNSAAVWNSAGTNAYADSTIDILLNTEIKALFDADVREAMGETTFPYTRGNGSTAMANLTRSVFLLSMTEYGGSYSNINAEGTAIPIAQLIEVGVSTHHQWTRSPLGANTTGAGVVASVGGFGWGGVTGPNVYRPAFTLHESCTVLQDVNPDGSYTLSLSDEKDELQLASLMAGDIVMVNEGGTPVEYYVAQQGYQPTINDTTRTLLVRKNCHSARQWHTSSVNTYPTSAIDAWLNGDFKALLDDVVRVAIGNTTFPYTVGNGSATISTLQRSVFLLSAGELGATGSYSGGLNVEGSALPIANILKIAYLDGVASTWWLRSVDKTNATRVWRAETTGTWEAKTASETNGVRPCFTLPNTVSIKAIPNFDNSYNLAITAEDVAMAAEASIMTLNYENGVYTEALNEMGVETE